MQPLKDVEINRYKIDKKKHSNPVVSIKELNESPLPAASLLKTPTEVISKKCGKQQSAKTQQWRFYFTLFLLKMGFCVIWIPQLYLRSAPLL